jgi:hypothetical protein
MRSDTSRQEAQLPVSKKYSCARCGGEVDLHGVYVIGFSKDSAMEWIYLCGGCEAGLREWLRAGEEGNE